MPITPLLPVPAECNAVDRFKKQSDGTGMNKDNRTDNRLACIDADAGNTKARHMAGLSLASYRVSTGAYCPR